MERQNKVAAVFDLDHTLTRRDTYLAFLVLALRKRPVRLAYCLHLPFAVLAYWTRLRNNTWLKEKFLAAILQGATRTQISQWAEEFTDSLVRSGLRARARNIIESHKSADVLLVMATASFDFYVTRLANRLGFQSVISTESAWDQDDRLEGRLKSGNCYGSAKIARLAEFFGDNRTDWKITAYSDHHKDAPMLEWADIAIAVNPTRQLLKIARTRNYDIQDWDHIR